MSRLIDADALIKKLESDAEEMEEPIAKMFTYAAINDVKHAPTVDAVPVRCKNCTHYNAGYECLIDGYGVERGPEWFCGDGERKDGEQHV